MATLAEILASKQRNSVTDPRPWDAGQGIGQAQPAPGPSSSPSPSPTPAGGGPDAAYAAAQQMADRQQAAAGLGAPGSAVLQNAPLGSIPVQNGVAQVPQGIWQQILQKLGMGGQ